MNLFTGGGSLEVILNQDIGLTRMLFPLPLIWHCNYLNLNVKSHINNSQNPDVHVPFNGLDDRTIKQISLKLSQLLPMRWN